MPELLVFGFLFVVIVWAIGMWLLVAGDREQDFTDEEDGFL